MAKGLKAGLGFAAVLLCAGAAMANGPERGAHPPMMGEPHPGPSGYQRVDPPKGWDARPATVDRTAYQHNFQAARSYHIGPYRPPHGYVVRRWAYGQVLPRVFWAPQYLVADYWLFALEVPPAGYEWVRYGNDALLISTDDGTILQVEYSVFA
jgi:Ni/Co efflux regulator RcnB